MFVQTYLFRSCCPCNHQHRHTCTRSQRRYNAHHSDTGCWHIRFHLQNDHQYCPYVFVGILYINVNMPIGECLFISETTALVAHEVSHRVQDTRHCVSRPTRADASVHCLADHTVRAASRPAICRPRVANGSSAQPRTLWTPLILSCRTNSMERTT